jgi:L-ascorbate metabolism protein UlaG (beta-lactamase superfamily)
VTIVTDPHDGKSIGIKSPNVKADIVLISHDHFDHNHFRVVAGRETKVFNREMDITKNGIRIQSMGVFHDDASGSKRGENLLFKFTIDGLSFCHLGDLGHLLDENTTMKVGPIDILFIPVGNVFTIGPKDAWKVINSLNPKVAIPMHYRVGGLSLSIKPIEPFLEDATSDSVVRVGNEIDFESEDLPEELEIWVFTM